MSKKKKNTNYPNYGGSNSYFPQGNFKIFFEDNSDSQWEEFRKQLLDIISKSQDDFESRLVLLSSGGLIIALTFLDKLFEYKIDINFKILIIISIVLFVISFISNLYSHILAIKNNEKNIEDVDNRNLEIIKNIVKRNEPVRYLNTISLFSISIGAIALFSFFLINFLNMSNKEQKPVEKPKTSQSEPKPLNEEKGRTTQTPSFSVKPKK